MGGGDRPVLGAGRAGRAPGGGENVPSAGARLGSGAPLLPPCSPRPAARVPSPWAGNTTPSSRRERWRGWRRLPAPGSDAACGTSMRTPSPSWARSLAAALNARDPGPRSLSTPFPIVIAPQALLPRPFGPTRTAVSRPAGLLRGVLRPGLASAVRSYDLGANRDTVLEALGSRQLRVLEPRAAYWTAAE